MEPYDLLDFQDILVKYPVAKKAREKGFYCVTPHRFLDDQRIIGGWIGSNTSNPSVEDIKNYLSDPNKLLIAPTAGVLHLWLKRFYNISVHTEPIYVDDSKTSLVFGAYLFINKNERVDIEITSKDESEMFEIGLFRALCRLP